MRFQRGNAATRRQYGRRLFFAYGALLLIVIAAVVVTQRSPRSVTVQRYGPNLVVDFVGILITLLLVERILVWQRERAEAPLRAIALRRVWQQMNRLVYMLLYSYKAAAPAGSAKPIALDALLDAWQREARHLDFQRSAGVPGSNRSWLVYAAEVTTDFESSVHEIIDRYLSVLGSEFAAAAEALIEDDVFAALKLGLVLDAYDSSSGRRPPRNSFSVRAEDDPTFDSTAHFADLLKALHDVYLRIGGRPLGVSAVFYNDDASPAWASGRVGDPCAAEDDGHHR